MVSEGSEVVERKSMLMTAPLGPSHQGRMQTLHVWRNGFWGTEESQLEILSADSTIKE
jgi:hypothetical protein